MFFRQFIQQFQADRPLLFNPLAFLRIAVRGVCKYALADLVKAPLISLSDIQKPMHGDAVDLLHSRLVFIFPRDIIYGAGSIHFHVIVLRQLFGQLAAVQF